MFVLRATILAILICFWYSYAKADTRELHACEVHLNKYRRFMLQAILNFEDVCDAYSRNQIPTSDIGLPPQIAFFGHYQPPEQKAEIWAFFKLLMAQFNDMDFANAVLERCQKIQQQQQQRDEKRNTVTLGKKQRFHSWGGKRSGGSELEQEHLNDDISGAF